MSSTFSPSLRIELIGDGDQSGIWGQTTNTNLGTLLEQAVAGVVSINMADTNYTMSNYNGVSDEARNQVLVLTGTNTAQRNLIAPLVEKTYIVKNSTTGGFSVQIIGSSGTGVVIPNGITALVYCDGTNFYNALTGSVSNFTVNGNLAVTGTTSLTGALSASTATFSGAISSVSPTFTGTVTIPTASLGDSTTKAASTAFVQTAIASATISGQITMWPTASAPSGWLICDGSAVSRSTYSALYAVVGTTFGSGDGSTTFNVPNYTNRMPYGTTIGATGGSADAIVVSHTHTASTSIADPGHQHAPAGGGQFRTINSSLSQGGGYTGSGGSSDPNTSTSTTGITASTSVSTTGASGTNANLPPYLGINFIIKT